MTRETGTDNYDVAKVICEGHLQEFERLIQGAHAADADPLAKFERKYGERFQLGEVVDLCLEGWDDPESKPAPEPITFDTLLAAWELVNTNKRTRRTKGRYMARFTEHLGHDDAAPVTPEDFAAFKEKLLTQANAGETGDGGVRCHPQGQKDQRKPL
jgi:hypothetical protein